MARDMVTVIQLCGVCREQLGSFEVNKENMMLSSTESLWCPHCEASRPEVRDIAGRLESIRKEVEGYPKPSTPSSRP